MHSGQSAETGFVHRAIASYFYHIRAAEGLDEFSRCAQSDDFPFVHDRDTITKTLRFVPQDKSVVLGLVSTKMNFLEDKFALKHRLDDASRYVALERLAVSPQCGFASTEAGNPISPRMQEAKLKLVVELAQETWGTA